MPKRRITKLSGPDAGTTVESEASPGFAGAVTDAAAALKSYAGKQDFVENSAAVKPQVEAASQGDAYTPSNAGKQSQSTDSSNGY